MCGECKYSEFQNGEYICTNEESECYGLETIYDCECDEYEETQDADN